MADQAAGAVSKAKEAAAKVEEAIINRFTANFVLERETKGTYRYQEEGTTEMSKGKIGTLYVQKSALPGGPQRITVVVESRK